MAVRRIAFNSKGDMSANEAVTEDAELAAAIVLGTAIDTAIDSLESTEYAQTTTDIAAAQAIGAGDASAEVDTWDTNHALAVTAMAAIQSVEVAALITALGSLEATGVGAALDAAQALNVEIDALQAGDETDVTGDIAAAQAIGAGDASAEIDAGDASHVLAVAEIASIQAVEQAAVVSALAAMTSSQSTDDVTVTINDTNIDTLTKLRASMEKVLNFYKSAGMAP